MTINRREFSDESVTDRYFLAAYEYSHYWEKEIGVSILAKTVRYFGSEEGAPAAVVYECLDGTSEWVKTDNTEWQVVTDDSDGEITDPCVWANFKLLKKDGTVYIAASEPVPVYEQEE